ncbi:mucin-13 [Sphaerodactylus townsendi]|uniref:mucin-13 n=1 Tax=Sphaerodactylus townsendi TaxID=933632 RepID=UPI00202621E0|nr:mucin-13 [Sphaerodactylus townsendi]
MKKYLQDLSCSLCTDCSPEDNRQCIIKHDVPQCQCMINSYRKGDKCQECDFGYSGENCENNYVAIIVGVAVACGIVIVVLAGVLIYKSTRAKKNLKPERRSLLSNDYLATDIASESKSTQNVAPRQKIFPRIQVKNPAGQGEWARNTGEGSSANSAYLPDQDYDDVDPSAFELKARSKF